MKTIKLVLPVTALLGFACSEPGNEMPGNGTPDSGDATDSGSSDGGPPDSGFPDASAPDAGMPTVRITYEPLGLEGVDIEEVHVIEDRLFAVTRSGLFWRELADGSAWSDAAFSYANAMIELSDGSLLLSEGITTPPGLHRSTDRGETWAAVGGHFGDLDPERALDFDRVGDALYATGLSVVARSMDGGRTWTPLYGTFGGFASGLGEVHVDPRDSEIWAGGQNAIEGQILLRSRDGGATWDQWGDLIGPPSTLKDIAFHPQDTQVVFAGFEEGLLRTEDDGGTWQTVIDRHEDSKFFMGVEIDREIPTTVYAGGWIKRFEEPQPMVLHISDDGGDTWTEHEGPAAFGGIWDMVQLDRSADEPAELILGLQRGGVYRLRIERP